MGASRSASVVIYYMMKKYKISYKKALEIVKTLRPVVNLTEKFHNTLNSILV
jgi:protein-tyrosine phosphatase